MRKTVIVAMVAIIGLMLGGCTRVHNLKGNVAHNMLNKYIERYTPDPEKYKVGDPDIKFYVKTVDRREDKIVFRNTDGFGLFTFDKYIFKKEDFKDCSNFVLKKALKVTNWGVSENLKDADFIVTANIKDFYFGHQKAVFVPLTKHIHGEISVAPNNTTQSCYLMICQKQGLM